jgi:hypothetical protein
VFEFFKPLVRHQHTSNGNFRKSKNLVIAPDTLRFVNDISSAFNPDGQSKHKSAAVDKNKKCQSCKTQYQKILIPSGKLEHLHALFLVCSVRTLSELQSL